jgi:long-chain fatty acid transport protein
MRFACWTRLACALPIVCLCSPAAASPLFELLGSNVGGGGGFNARGSGPSAASTYFNPGLLPRSKQGLDLGWFVLNDAISLTLDARSSAVDVPLSAQGRVRTDTPPVPTAWLEQGCSPDTGNCARDVPAQPRQSEGSSGNVRAYQVIGLVNHLIDDYLTLGFYAMIPLSTFTQAHSFFVDEREQFGTNSLHPELYSDRLTPVSLCFGGGSRLTDWFSFGLSFTLGLTNTADALAYVGNSARLNETLQLSTKVDVSASVSPHLGFVFTPLEGFDLSVTMHSPQKMVIESAFAIYLPNGDVQSASRTATHAYLPWIAGLAANYALNKRSRNVWELTGTVTYERWSQYVNRQNERPLKDYEWRDIPTGALGVRITHDQQFGAFLDANYRPSPVPAQTGRTNYVDNDRYGVNAGLHYDLPFPSWKVALRFAGQGQVHLLTERHQTKIDPTSPALAGQRYSQLVVDEFPDDSINISTGMQIPEAAGLQTNNPGWPGFSSRGFLVGGGVSISLLY